MIIGRRTGRTTRMLLWSVVEFLEGNDVAVVAHSIEYTHELKVKCLRIFTSLDIPVTPGKTNEILFNGNRLIFISFSQRERLRGLNMKVNYDHYFGGY